MLKLELRRKCVCSGRISAADVASRGAVGTAGSSSKRQLLLVHDGTSHVRRPADGHAL